MGLTVPLLFDVILHFGTLLVTLIYFRGAIINVLRALWRRDFHSQDGMFILPIIVGSIPTALIAATIGDQMDTYFSSLLWLGVWFIITGVLLTASKFTTERKSTISLPEALLIGVMQGLSVIPSVSRSGFTIATMMLLGIKREVAFKFSFLLSIPAVVGALGITLYQEHSLLSTMGIGAVEIAAALAVTIAVSFLALKLLWKVLASNKFYLFAVYCFAIGAVLVALELLGF